MASQVTASPNFEGWYIHPDGTTEPLTCPRGTFATSGTYAVCCDKSTRCPMPTACHDNKISYDNFAVGACPGSAVCQTMSIMSAPGARADVTSSIFCAQYWYALEAYRDTVPVTPTTTKTTSTKPSSASTGSTPTSNSASVTTSPSSSTPSSPTASPTESAGAGGGGGASKAWIAGAVVGPVAGLALLGLAVWFFRRRGAAARGRSKVDAAEAPQEMGGGDGNWQNKQYYGASHPKSESTSAGYYAPVQQNQVHELPSGDHQQR
ncbi:hypothetical protein ISF_04876 [Cordyceps fumosorosea ARSEF 2679]|uniref:Uncharacterized protein n=1 Tax=Cordyceps fumosorosea (strain ARSEF 2679) TaxID=1081104 RepID=A0A167VUR8_CORFA|nr:hypothetical protein ISF_04876 [Cordyceps fumosorosea ARSEF 2679]OAA63000.1 hypothetical protein ISF_04876 [Cordyceps fumosorosea ARSEF 2679]